MKGKSFAAIAFVLGLIVFSIIYIIVQQSRTQHNWLNSSYLYDDKEPYGSFIFYHYLKNLKEDSIVLMDKSISNYLKNNTDSGSTYVYINSSHFHTDAELNDLLKFVQRGNTALVIVPTFNKSFISAFKGIEIKKEDTESLEEEAQNYYESETGISLDSTNYNYDEDQEYSEEEYASNEDIESTENEYEEYQENTIVEEEKYYSFNLFDDNLVKIEFNHNVPGQPFSFFYRIENDTITQQYYTFKDTSTHFKSLAQYQNKVSNGAVFAEIKSGKGRFIIHTLPLAFSNYHLTQKDGKNHLAAVLSYIPLKKIYWDNYSFNFRYDFSDLGYSSDTPLSYILNQKSFKWAFYIFLTCSLIYILFNIKRIQKAIPILGKKANTSLEYIRSVGLLYFNYRNNREIADKMMHQFYTDVYMKYRIQHRQQNNFVMYLSKRSGFPEEKIIAIIQYHKSIMEMLAEPSDEIIVDFYKKLQEFYLKRK